MSVSHKAFLTAVTSAGSLLLAVSLRVFAVDDWISAVLVSVLVLIAARVAGAIVKRTPTLDEYDRNQRRDMAFWARVAVLAHGAWQLAGVFAPGLEWRLLVGLAVLTAVEYWTARALEYFARLPRSTPSQAVAVRGAKATEAAAVVEAGQRVLTTAEEVFQLALNRAGFGYLQLIGPGEGFGRGMRFSVRVPSRYALAARDTKTSSIKALTRDSAEEIAIALNEITGSRLTTDWVKVRKEPTAGEWTITVATSDVMAEVVPYVDSPGWTTIREEAFVGLETDGTRVMLNLAQHGQAIGKSISGKTSLLNAAFGHITRSGDAIPWVLGVEKLYDTMGPWLEPYAGTDEPVPFDWVAHGQEDGLAMMIAAMQVARYRQSLPYSQREDWPKLIVVLDEASFFLKNRTFKLPYQGVHYNASEMLAMGMQGAGSAGVHFVLATQRGTNGQFGDEGGNAKANFGWSAVFKSQDAAEVGRITGDYKLEPLTHKGEYYLATDGEPVRKVKAPYIQETDPARPRLHDGATVADVSWSRRGLVKSLDAGSQRAAGEAYARRHRSADALINYLTSAPVATQPVRSSVEQLVGAEVAAFDALTATPEGATYVEGIRELVVDEIAAAKSRRQHIAEIVEDLGEASIGEIEAALAERGDEVTDRQVIYNALGKLVDAGTLARVDGAKGRYRTA